MNARVLLIGPSDTSFIGSEALPVEFLLLQSAAKLTHYQRDHASEVRIVDLTDQVECRTAAQQLDAVGRIDAVIAFFEPWLDIAAVICADLGLPGNALSAVRAAKHKAWTRELVRGAMLRNPRWTMLGPGGDLASAAEHAGFPCVIKPVAGAGSKGVVVLNDDRDLAPFGPVDAEVIVEQYVSGVEVSVESFSRNGHHEVVAVTGKVMSTGRQRVDLAHWMPFEGRLPHGFDLGRSISELLHRVGHVIGPAHTEIMIGDDVVYLVETHTRYGGNRIWQLCGLTLGRYPQPATIAAHLGLPDPRVAPVAPAAAVSMVTSEAGHVRSVAGAARAAAAPGVQEVSLDVAVGAHLGPLLSSDDYLGYVLATGKTPGAAVQAVDDALAEISIELD